MMRVTVEIGGRTIHAIEVVNLGPVSGVYEAGDGPGGGGFREYTYESTHVVDGHRTHITGRVQHRRDDGALTLAAIVLEQLRGVKNRRTVPRG
jgi:hypothetical protein